MASCWSTRAACCRNSACSERRSGREAVHAPGARPRRRDPDDGRQRTANGNHPNVASTQTASRTPRTRERKPPVRKGLWPGPRFMYPGPGLGSWLIPAGVVSFARLRDDSRRELDMTSPDYGQDDPRYNEQRVNSALGSPRPVDYPRTQRRFAENAGKRWPMPATSASKRTRKSRRARCPLEVTGFLSSFKPFCARWAGTYRSRYLKRQEGSGSVRKPGAKIVKF